MKVLIWNGRRIGKVEKQREGKDYIRAQEADWIGLVETKVRSGKAARITRCLGKDCSKAITMENEAGNGRIWLIWNITMTLTRYRDLIRLYLVAAGTKELINIFFCLGRDKRPQPLYLRGDVFGSS